MRNCLIIDDSPFDRRLLTHSLERLGVSSEEVGTAEQALELCSRDMPHCILLDWEMPGMGSLELLKKIRALPGGKDIPVIICTSNDQPRDLCHAHRDGASDFIFKPVTIGRLQVKLQAAGLLAR